MKTVKAKIKDEKSSWEEDFKVISLKTAKRDILATIDDFNSDRRPDQTKRELVAILSDLGEAEKNVVKQLSFYTLGPNFTNLLRMFIEEGNFLKVHKILKDGGMTVEMIKDFFLYKLRFHGDTRTEEGLFVIPELAEKNFDLKEIYTTAISTCLANGKDVEMEDDEDGEGEYPVTYQHFRAWEWKSALKKASDVTINGKNPKYNYSKDLECIFQILGTEKITELAALGILAREGYVAKKDPTVKKDHIIDGNGVILRDGSYITCSYMDHINLFPILFQLGLSSSSDWTHDDMTIHVSSGQFSGTIANTLDHPKDYWRGPGPTEKQIESLFFFREHIMGEYGGVREKSTTEMIRRYTQYKEDHGGKYNNLAFLEKFYPHIRLPKFSKEKMEGKVCIRTSPERSMPGLLNSKFDVNEGSIKEIEKEFRESIKLTGKSFSENKLHYFFQEYLDGSNGVCHYWEKGKFTYSYSDQRGDTVKGVKSDKVLSKKLEGELKGIAKLLSEDLKQSVQLEFVIHNEEIYIVQLRILENNPSNTTGNTPPKDAILTGKSFCTGPEWYKEHADGITLDDILIVESDGESKELIGKKALIVKSNVEFSHLLALSKVLVIPSMFDTGEIDLEKLKGKLDFSTRSETGWIRKSTK